MILAMDLSSASVKALSEKLRAYQKAVPQKLDLVCRKVAEVGESAAQGACRSVEVAASVHVEPIADGYSVVADDEQAAFIEFGTGVVGEGTYNGDLPPEWEYNAMWTPLAHDINDPTKWYYYDASDRLRSTRGQEADEFMLEASRVMQESAEAIAKDVFR